MTPQQYILAQRWELAQQQVNRLLASELDRLEQYSNSEGANPKAVAVRERHLEVLANYVTVTDELVQEQGNMLQELQQQQKKLDEITDERDKMALYLKYLGVDVDVLNYMKKTEMARELLHR
jgi:vacuolar-type H+-ATPase subunit I/STV1